MRGEAHLRQRGREGGFATRLLRRDDIAFEVPRTRPLPLEGEEEARGGGGG